MKIVRKVSIEVTSWLKEDFGGRPLDNLVLEETITSGTTIADLIRNLAEKYRAFGEKTRANKEGITGYCLIILNGKIASSVELGTKLKEGDIIKLIPTFYGG